MKAQLGKWRTNARERHVGVKAFTRGLLVGPPKSTPACTFDELQRDGIVGLYEKRGKGERRT